MSTIWHYIQEKSIGQIMWRNDTESEWNWCMFDVKQCTEWIDDDCNMMVLTMQSNSWILLWCLYFDYHFYHILQNQKLGWLSFTFKSNKFAISWEKYWIETMEEVFYNRWVIVVHVKSIYSSHFSLNLELVHWICLFYWRYVVL